MRRSPEAFDGGRVLDLVDPLGEHSDAEIAARTGVERTAVWKWRHGGMLRATTADRVAVRLGRHPAELWPEWFDVA